MISHAELLRVIHYDPLSGEMRWRVSLGRAAAGNLVGTLDPRGYRMTVIHGEKYWLHRLAWFYVQGVWPKNHVDHKKGDRDDNRIANLDDVTPSWNYHNTTKLGNNNTTGYRGVTRYGDKFIAQGMIERKLHVISMRDTAEEASEDYKKWHIDNFGALPENTNTKVYPRMSRAKKENLQ